MDVIEVLKVGAPWGLGGVMSVAVFLLHWHHVASSQAEREKMVEAQDRRSMAQVQIFREELKAERDSNHQDVLLIANKIDLLANRQNAVEGDLHDIKQTLTDHFGWVAKVEARQ